MGHVVGPQSSPQFGGSNSRRKPFFVVQIVRQYGFRGVIALLAAALVAFIPVAVLAWFNAARLTSTVVNQCGHQVVVKPERFDRDKESDEPGETALLHISCDIPTIDGKRELLRYDDPNRRTAQIFDPCYVRNECVYLRKAGDFNLPFGLLGKPPISVWLPAGDYEIAVVHDAPRSEPRIDSRSHGFPLVMVFANCTLPAKEQTTQRVFLPHYDWGNSSQVLPAKPIATGSVLPEIEFRPLSAILPELTSIPTPGGYLLAIAEPNTHHSDGHRECVNDFADLRTVPREWTRNQIATLRHWLPKNAPARTKLRGLISALEWREFFAGWFCYAAAGISGLVFTKWGALLILERHRRRESLVKSAKQLTKIFLVAVAAWFLFQRMAG